MENGLKFLAGMFRIMFFDVEEVSKGDYRTSFIPLEDFKTSNNFLFNPQISHKVYPHLLVLVFVQLSLPNPCSALCCLRLERPQERTETCLLPWEEGGVRRSSNCADMLPYPYSPPHVLNCHAGVGLVQWFSKCGLWTKCISTTWELDKNANFWVPYHIN